ncbi:hypothetical protein EG329_008455 [Mollisiaceae sp. DMI_Dod_QoI]|nr:hypothetical protein EG329_008455 [Helotiales sp. DMI_Dod_QoI]
MGKEEYTKLEDGEDGDIELIPLKKPRFLQRYIFTARNAILLAVLLLASGFAFVWAGSHLRNGRWHPQTMVPRIPVSPHTFHLTDHYMAYTEESDQAWDDLVPIQHGLIGLENPYKYDLRPGHPDPDNADMAWFGISVFHQLHCLSASRDTLRSLKTDQPARIWGGLMCAADTTIEWPTFVKTGFQDDGPITGEGIAHQCRDWDAVLAFGMQHGALKSTVGLNLSRVIE